MTRLQTCALAAAGAALLFGAGCWVGRRAPADRAELVQLRRRQAELLTETMGLRIRDQARTSADRQRTAAVALLERRTQMQLDTAAARSDRHAAAAEALRAALLNRKLEDAGAALALVDQLDSTHAGAQQACMLAVSSCQASLALERERVASRDSGIVEREHLIAGYQVQLDSAIGLAARWRPPSTLRQALRATSCAAAGYGAAKGNAAVGLAGGGVCVVSLVW